MGFETKILTAIEEIAPHRASFTNGALSLVDVGADELDQITEAIREICIVPFNVRCVEFGEYLVDFDFP